MLQAAFAEVICSAAWANPSRAQSLSGPSKRFKDVAHDEVEANEDGATLTPDSRAGGSAGPRSSEPSEVRLH